jgi:uncharacterized membrane protein
MEGTESEVTRLTIRPPPDEEKHATRHYYHTMVQFLKAVFIYFSILAAMFILSILVWGALLLIISYLIYGTEPILQTIL